MRKNALFYSAALLLSTALVLSALPVFAGNGVNLPQQASTRKVFLLMERVSTADVSGEKKKESLSSLTRLLARGLYEMETRGQLNQDFVEKNRKEIFSTMADYQAGIVSAKEFIGRVGQVQERVYRTVDVPIVTVTDEMPLGLALLNLPNLISKNPGDLTEKEIGILVDAIVNEAEKSGEELNVTEVESGEIRGIMTSGRSGEGLLQGKWKDPDQRSIFEERKEKEK